MSNLALVLYTSCERVKGVTSSVTSDERVKGITFSVTCGVRLNLTDFNPNAMCDNIILYIKIIF